MNSLSPYYQPQQIALQLGTPTFALKASYPADYNNAVLTGVVIGVVGLTLIIALASS